MRVLLQNYEYSGLRWYGASTPTPTPPQPLLRNTLNHFLANKRRKTEEINRFPFRAEEEEDKHGEQCNERDKEGEWDQSERIRLSLSSNGSCGLVWLPPRNLNNRHRGMIWFSSSSLEDPLLFFHCHITLLSPSPQPTRVKKMRPSLISRITNKRQLVNSKHRRREICKSAKTDKGSNNNNNNSH